jgi:hypothetical protein
MLHAPIEWCKWEQIDEITWLEGCRYCKDGLLLSIGGAAWVWWRRWWKSWRLARLV